MTTYDLIVIGCGGIGSAALYSATHAGLKTLCIDQYNQGHDHGGTHGETRAFRMAYYDDPKYIPLLKQAYIDWKNIEKRANKKLFIENGVLEIGSPTGTMVLGAIKSSEKYGIHIEILTAEQIISRFPEFHIPEGMVGIFQTQAGFLYVDECVKYFIEASESAAATVLYDEKVLSWSVDANKIIHIKTNKNIYHSKYLIVAAGSWATDIFPDLNIPLIIVQKTLLWASIAEDSYGLNSKTPCFAYHLINGIFYGFPAISNYIKIARHNGGAILKNPEESINTINREEIEAIKKFIAEYLNRASLNNIKIANCLYDNTPDKQFIVDVHPNYPQIAFATGLSGHGYKMSNVLGDVLVELVTNNSTKYDISFLSLKRFQNDRAQDWRSWDKDRFI